MFESRSRYGSLNFSSTKSNFYSSFKNIHICQFKGIISSIHFLVILFQKNSSSLKFVNSFQNFSEDHSFTHSTKFEKNFSSFTFADFKRQSLSVSIFFTENIRKIPNNFRHCRVENKKREITTAQIEIDNSGRKETKGRSGGKKIIAGTRKVGNNGGKVTSPGLLLGNMEQKRFVSSAVAFRGDANANTKGLLRRGKNGKKKKTLLGFALVQRRLSRVFCAKVGAKRWLVTPSRFSPFSIFIFQPSSFVNRSVKFYRRKL